MSQFPIAILALVLTSTAFAATPSSSSSSSASSSSSSSSSVLSSLVTNWGLTSSYNFSFPSTTLDSNDATSWLKSNWDLNSNRIDFGTSNIVFSPDPDTTSSTLVRRASTTTTTTTSISYPASTSLGGEAPVLRINYPAGSYSKSTGGTQFYAQPLNASSSTKESPAAGSSTSDGSFERMLLRYDVWFPTGFAWNMGGKLPGLRGGPDPRGCSGGNETDGTTCFSARLMWRSNGAGEVYAYIPTNGTTNLCSNANIICNSDYGTSLSRGSFTFATGQWQTIYLLVVLNKVGEANGVVQLYYNGVQALSYSNLELRSAASLSSIGGLYFSTFFGGDTSDYATPTSQYTYFRNIQIYAGLGSANGTGSSTAKSSAELSQVLGFGWSIWGAWGAIAVALLGGLIGMIV